MWTYKGYIAVLGTLVSSEVTSVLLKNPGGQTYNLTEFLKGREVSLELKGYSRRKALHLGQVVGGAIDIGDQLDKLRAYEVYIEEFNYKGEKLTRTQHLRYTIENYLNDIFVLKNRMKKYLQKIMLLYSRDPNSKQIRKSCRHLLRRFPEIYDRILTLRGIHVHNKRYSESNIEMLERVEFISKVSNGGSKQSIRALFEIETRKQYAKWTRILKELNDYIEKDIDGVCDELCPLILNRNKNIRYPRYRDMVEESEMFT